MRKLSLRQATNAAKKLDIDLVDVTVYLDDTEFCDKIFTESTRDFDLPDMFNVKISVIRNVLGGVSAGFLRKGNIPGVDYLGDGTCNIDLSKRIFIVNNITHQDIVDNKRKIYLSAEAVDVINYPSITKKNLYKKVSDKPEARQKYGTKLWLYNAAYIDDLKFESGIAPVRIVHATRMADYN